MIVIGIDDTDMPGVGGTGRLARRLAAFLEAAGLAISRGVTRHQLYRGSGVPMTSHNSAAAITCAPLVPVPVLCAQMVAFVERGSISGSDPGVAMLTGPAPAGVLQFARRAQQELVTQAEALRVAAGAGIEVVGLGGTEDGVIGALSAVALRDGGDDGRFIDLRGIREVTGAVPVGRLLHETGIARVVDLDHGETLDDAVILDVGNWVRPRLIGGLPVLAARREKGKWVNADAHPQRN